MTTRARSLSVGLGGAFLLGLVGYLSRPAPAPPAPAAQAPAVETARATEPVRSTPHIAAAADSGRQPGARRTYDVDLTQTVLLAAGEDTALIKGLHASWTITFVSGTNGVLRYRAVLSAVRAQANGQPYPEGPFLQDFARPFFFETDREGKVTAVTFDRATGSDAKGTIKALVASAQVAFHADGSDSWTVKEQDPTGEYEAVYTRSNDERHLKKERTKYLQIATENGLRPASDAAEVSVRDNTAIEVLLGGDVDKLVSENETDMQFGRGMPRVHLTTALTVRLQRSDVDVAGLRAMNDEWANQQRVAMASPPMADDPKAQEKADAKTLKGAVLSDLERELAALPRSSSRDRAVQMSRLQADFRLRPDDTQKVIPYVRTAAVPDGQAVTAALGGTGTPQALAALADIARSQETPMPVRANAIGALAISQTPSSESVQALKSMTSDPDKDVSSAATLALGAAAATARGIDPASYQDAIAMLLADLAAAQTPEQTVLYLRALGNSGDPRVLAAAENAMSSDSVSVRIAAVAAVRFVPGADTDQFLVMTMDKDADASVRVQAVATVEGYRVLAGYVGTFGQRMQADDSPLVRRAILHALNTVKSEPAAIAIIRAAAERDPRRERPSVRASSPRLRVVKPTKTPTPNRALVGWADRREPEKKSED